VDEEMTIRLKTFRGDNDGRRSGVEGRFFTYATHIPERRMLTHRRVVRDRRTCGRHTIALIDAV
jgi:hypothetical protein